MEMNFRSERGKQATAFSCSLRVLSPDGSTSKSAASDASGCRIQLQGFNVTINNRCFVARCARPLLLGNEMLVKLSSDGRAATR
jgi:hypothetical protein